MKVEVRHGWNLTPSEAIKLQNELVKELRNDQPLDVKSIGLIAGVDVSVKHEVSQAAVVVSTFPDMKVIETVLVQQPTPFPYIPGLLSFREGPALTEAFEKLEHEPDVFIFDGMGRAHPRRMGIAAHMGLWLQKPTIGCGKTWLIGKYVEPEMKKGSFSEMVDKNEVIGVALRTRDNIKPVYISAGHLIDLPSAVHIVMACTPKYRLPEPIRQAHNAAGKFE